MSRISELCLSNADALLDSLDYCTDNGIGAFRVNSQILPLKTHPGAGYEVHELPDSDDIISRFNECGDFAREHNIRLSFHPDQFVVLNSPNSDTLAHSITELDYQAEVAEWIGADTITLHGGGAYGDKVTALRALRRNIEKLSDRVRSRLALENDDRVYTPSDLLPVCTDTGVPFVYDIHHHRCLPDGLTIAEVTDRARMTWKREPLFHISSPLEGWDGKNPRRHHDYINPEDFPDEWLGWKLTVEVEAKAKELAVGRLLAYLHRKLI